MKTSSGVSPPKGHDLLTLALFRARKNSPVGRNLEEDRRRGVPLPGTVRRLERTRVGSECDGFPVGDRNTTCLNDFVVGL